MACINSFIFKATKKALTPLPGNESQMDPDLSDTLGVEPGGSPTHNVGTAIILLLQGFQKG